MPSLEIKNLLKSTIAAATRKLMDDGTVDWCVSVFVDNAGVIRFDDTDSVTFKVETHNRPSAIERMASSVDCATGSMTPGR